MLFEAKVQTLKQPTSTKVLKLVKTLMQAFVSSRKSLTSEEFLHEKTKIMQTLLTFSALATRLSNKFRRPLTAQLSETEERRS